MRLLVFEWNAGTYTHDDVISAFSQMGISCHTVSYAFSDMYDDEFFEWRFGKEIDDGNYDAIYSTNYFPLVAICAHKRRIPYIAWSYDNPLPIHDVEKTIGFEENRVFLFDKIQAEGFIRKGFNNVYHMPLAVNTDRLDAISLTKKDIDKYTSEISFVGKLYESPLPAYLSIMDEYLKGYIGGILQAQKNIYGYYFIDELLDSELINKINSCVEKTHPDIEIRLTKEALSYAIGAQITREDRLLLLRLLGSHFQVKLYSREDNEMLRNVVQYMGSCRYDIEMPKIFKASKINLNINLRVSQSGIPLRVMDVLGCGGFLISSYQPELAEYFVNGRDVILYESIEDAYEKVEYYLKHEDERIQIAKNGYEAVKQNFNYVGQFEKIFKIANI